MAVSPSSRNTRLQAKPAPAPVRREFGLVLAGFAALFVFVCLVSYILPLLRTPPLVPQVEGNWCGVAGYYLAHALLSFLGLAAFFPVLAVLYLAVSGCRREPYLNSLPWVVSGLSGLMVSLAGLLAMGERLWLPPEHVAPGGHVGSLLQRLLGGVVGPVGTFLVLFCLLVLSLMAALRFSPAESLECCRTLGGRLRRALRHCWPLLLERLLPQRPVSRNERGPARDLGPELLLPPLVAPPPARVATPAIIPPVGRASEETPDCDFVLEPVRGEFALPPLSLLDRAQTPATPLDEGQCYEVSHQLTAKLEEFGVAGSVSGISPGPVVTTYEFAPAPGVKITKVAALADDLALALRAESVRIVGSLPGKAALGIEIPNVRRQVVSLREVLTSDSSRAMTSPLGLALGLDVVGRPVVADLAKMPHLLVAGATGSGKSVAINAFVASMLFKASPEEVRLLMVDPKRIELSVYEGIPHLLHPVVVEARMASRALMWAVREMERRYRLLEEARVKNIASYNEQAEEKLPFVVIIVDELADLMMVASKEVETAIARLAQMARAAGMHLILATQRPSVDVLTGLIKANFPTRISFKVASKVDSRTILDCSGAEHLLGAGDMLFLPPGTAKLQRIHGAYVSEAEIERITSCWREQGQASYDEAVLREVERGDEGDDDDGGERDERYDEAVALVRETGQASISMVQRRLRVGYNRAARMIEMMEREGIVGPADGVRPREVRME